VLLCRVIELAHAECMSGDSAEADITFANNVSVIPLSPTQLRRHAVLRERNLAQQLRSRKSWRVLLLHCCQLLNFFNCIFSIAR